MPFISQTGAQGVRLFGDAAAGLFGASANFGAAKALGRSAEFEELGGKISAASTNLQLDTTRREVGRVIGGQQADVAAAGFSAS